MQKTRRANIGKFRT